MANSNNYKQFKVRELSPKILHSLIGQWIQLLESSYLNNNIIDYTQLLHIPNPCIIHIVEIDKLDKNYVKVWLKEYIINEDEPIWQYDSNKYREIRQQRKLAWVCRWLKLHPTWALRLLSDLNAKELVEERGLPSYYRIRGDWHHYDREDGVDVVCRYPVWVNETLLEGEEGELCRQRLCDAFHLLNDKQQDRHPYPSPVEDIVDPDLLPYCPSSSKTLNTSLRNSYQWIPSKFIINNETNEVSIASPICHLEDRNGIYNDVSTIFSKMLPMFREIKDLELNNGQTQLQVVVKVQSYNMRQGMAYSGRWHTEGQTEHILGVGVYYLHVDRLLKGGVLKFRSQEALEFGSHEVDVHTGAAIVFENCIPHRFRQIQNLSTKDRRRTFLNFFIVDPRYPIPLDSSRICFCYRNQIWDILDKAGLRLLNTDNGQERRRLADLMIERILSFLPNIWLNIEQAKEFRQHTRNEMLEKKSGWGWIQFGNSGIVRFIEKADKNQEELRHTESD